jgi:hypothetical protein
VTERTEGWPAGLYLAALMAHDSNGEALTISGEDRYVADYLYLESLIHLPETIQRFLRYTAVLDQLCAPLASSKPKGALCGSGWQPAGGSETYLRRHLPLPDGLQRVGESIDRGRPSAPRGR